MIINDDMWHVWVITNIAMGCADTCGHIINHYVSMSASWEIIVTTNMVSAVSVSWQIFCNVLLSLTIMLTYAWHNAVQLGTNLLNKHKYQWAWLEALQHISTEQSHCKWVCFQILFLLGYHYIRAIMILSINDCGLWTTWLGILNNVNHIKCLLTMSLQG